VPIACVAHVVNSLKSLHRDYKWNVGFSVSLNYKAY
jgi:hypothetical protein